MQRAVNVAVVATRRSPDSVSIARYYMQRRRVPESHLLLIDCVPQEEVALAEYRDTIERPVAELLRQRRLEESVDYLVLTKGVPLRIREGGFSVDSALMCYPLKRPFSTELRESNLNPYFGKNERFSRRKYGFYLATRLDGYTMQHIRDLVDNSLNAKRANGVFLLDLDPKRNGGGYRTINESMRAAAKLLKARGFEVILDENEAFVGAVRDIMGYYSWGSNDHKFNKLSYRSLRFRPGAIAETAVSTSARTFQVTDKGQSLIADLIGQGATGVKGYVSEPYTAALCRAEIMFDLYTRGRTLAESLWAASPFILWKDLVVGDPLCAPFAG
ncbi:MAG: TIGR03790 family protein [Fimbriimonadales bacterium]|nr:TIGR03790 family protein [Fimbriimonadales bacterium]